MNDHYHYDYANAQHSHGDYAYNGHDHDYAERYHRHYDDESTAAGLREDLGRAEERIREMEERLDRALARIGTLEERLHDHEQTSPAGAS